MAIAKPAYKLPVAIQRTGLRAVQRIPVIEFDQLRTTAAGRSVAVTFVTDAGKRPTNIYLDEISSVIHRRETRTYGVVVKKSAKKVAKKAAEKALFKRSEVRESIKIRGHWNGASFVPDRGESITRRVRRTHIGGVSIVVANDNPTIPASIKRLILHFFNNLRKLICPRAGAKPSLSTGGQATISGIAVWLAAHLGVAVGVATSLATAVLVVIATATKGAFCDMTAEMAKAAIQKA